MCVNCNTLNVTFFFFCHASYKTWIKFITICYTYIRIRIGGSVVECSPATRAARVRFPADANLLFILCVLFSLFSYADFVSILLEHNEWRKHPNFQTIEIINSVIGVTSYYYGHFPRRQSTLASKKSERCSAIPTLNVNDLRKDYFSTIQLPILGIRYPVRPHVLCQLSVM